MNSLESGLTTIKFPEKGPPPILRNGDAARDTDREMRVVLLVLILCGGALSQEPAPEELKPGLIAEFFNIGKPMEEFPTVAAERKPDFRRVDFRIDGE